MKHGFTETGPAMIGAMVTLFIWVGVCWLIPDTWVDLNKFWTLFGWFPTVLLVSDITYRLDN